MHLGYGRRDVPGVSIGDGGGDKMTVRAFEMFAVERREQGLVLMKPLWE